MTDDERSITYEYFSEWIKNEEVLMNKKRKRERKREIVINIFFKVISFE